MSKQEYNLIKAAMNRYANHQFFSMLGLNMVMEAGLKAVEEKVNLDKAIQQAVEQYKLTNILSK